MVIEEAPFENIDKTMIFIAPQAALIGERQTTSKVLL